MRKIIVSACITLIIVVFSTSTSFAQETINLKDAVNRALENNMQVKQAQFQAAVTEQDVRQAKMNFFPTLNSGASGNKNWGSYFDPLTGKLNSQNTSSMNGSINSSVSLFQGFQRINQVSLNKYALLADNSTIERVKSDLSLSVVTTYLDALTNQELARASVQQLELSTKQLKVEEINFDVGNKTLADLAQAKSQVAQDELNLTSSQNAYELALLNLKQLMEMELSEDIQLVEPSLPSLANIESTSTAKEIYGVAEQIYPEIEYQKYNVEVAKKSISIAKGGYYPTLSLSGGISTGYSSTFFDPETNARMEFRKQLTANRSESVGISLNIPIFNNLRTRINVQKAKISYENALLGEQKAKNDLNKVINQAVLDLKAASKSYASSGSVFESMKEAFNVIQQRYDVGLANAIELSTSQTNMNRAEFNHITSKYNLVFRRKVIDFYLGKDIFLNN